MKFFFSEQFLKKYPNHQIAFGIITGVDIYGPDERSKKILDDAYPKVIEEYQESDLPSLSTSLPYLALEKRIASGDRFGFPYDQIKRVLDGKGIHNINNIVNTYMVYELLSNLSFSSYDLDSIEEYLEITVSKQNETMTLIGGKTVEIPAGDLIFKDKTGIFYSFSKGYADRTKISKSTKNVLYTIDAPEGISKTDVEINIKKLCEEFNSNDYFILDRNLPVKLS